MSTSQECPSPQCLEDLLHDSLSDEDQSQIESHLGLCGQCRTRIEQLAIGPPWVHGNNVASEALGSQNTFLEELKGRLKRKQMSDSTIGESPRDDASTLDFLAPSEARNSLGKMGIYDIMGVIGSGGMGIVLKGHDPRLNRIVAIKVLSPSLASNANARKRFLVEAIRRVCDDEPRPIQEIRSDMPVRLIETIKGLLEKNPSKRIQTAAELEDILEKQLAHLQQGGAMSHLSIPAVHRRGSMSSSTNCKSRRRWFWGTACSFVLLLALGAYITGGVMLPSSKRSNDVPPPPIDPVAQYTATLSGIDLEQATSLLQALPNRPDDISAFKQLERKFWWDKVYEFASDGSVELSGTAHAVARAWHGRVSFRCLNDCGQKCRENGLHTSADRFFVASSDEARLGHDMREVMWKTVNRSRVRRDLHDFEAGERFLSEAIQMLEMHSPRWFLKNKRAGDDVFLHYRRAICLGLLGQSEEAQAEFTYVVQKMEKCAAEGERIWWLDCAVEESSTYHNACLESGHLAPDVVIQHLSDKSDWWALPVVVKAYLMKGDFEAAIQTYTAAATSETHQTEVTLDACEKALLNVVLVDPSHATRVRKVFERLVELQRKTLAPKHPRRAFTMQRLAQILIHQGRDLDKAHALLSEASEILSSHSLAPPSVTKEITDLLAEVEKMQSHATRQ